MPRSVMGCPGIVACCLDEFPAMSLSPLRSGRQRRFHLQQARRSSWHDCSAEKKSIGDTSLFPQCHGSCLGRFLSDLLCQARASQRRCRGLGLSRRAGRGRRTTGGAPKADFKAWDLGLVMSGLSILPCLAQSLATVRPWPFGTRKPSPGLPHPLASAHQTGCQRDGDRLTFT